MWYYEKTSWSWNEIRGRPRRDSGKFHLRWDEVVDVGEEPVVIDNNQHQDHDETRIIDSNDLEHHDHEHGKDNNMDNHTHNNQYNESDTPKKSNL